MFIVIQRTDADRLKPIRDNNKTHILELRINNICITMF